MQVPFVFLVVDDNPDSRYLLVKTLKRKFPEICCLEVDTYGAAVEAAKNRSLHAVIVHRAADVDGLAVVRSMRLAQPAIPIVMVSGVDRSKAAQAAGATAFLHYDEWLRIGTVVAEAMMKSA